MVIVSHDRHLIKTVADSLWLVAGGKLTAFDGDLDDYQQSLRSRDKAEPRAAGNAAPRRARQAAPAALKSRNRVSALRRELGQIETRITAIAAERALIEEELCKNPTHGGLQEQHADLMRDGASLETRWMEVGTELESAEAAVEYPD